MKTVSKDMMIKQVIAADDFLAEILMDHGMHCLGCPMHTMETLEQACAGHGIDADELVGKLNEYLASKSE